MREEIIKYIDVYHVQPDAGEAGPNYWAGFVYLKEDYERQQKKGEAAEPIQPIDVWAAADEVTLLSRVKVVHPSLLIGMTDGEVLSLPF